MESATAFDDDSAEGSEKKAMGWKNQLKVYTQTSGGDGHNRKYNWLDELKNRYSDTKLPKIQQVGIYHDHSYCHGFSVTYADGTQNICKADRGATHDTLDLEADEYLIGIRSRTGAWFDQLTF
jgi:hypothetical protein